MQYVLDYGVMQWSGGSDIDIENLWHKSESDIPMFQEYVCFLNDEIHFLQNNMLCAYIPLDHKPSQTCSTQFSVQDRKSVV